ncbi:ABC transporter substrate-binding protein [Thermodesulfobacteriota bacterium]
MRNESKLRELVLMSIALCLSIAMLTLSPAQGETAPKHGGIVRIAVARDAIQIGDPVVRPFYSLRMAAVTVETLLRFDKKGILVPWLATGYEVSKDLNSITITLRKGVKFHDGTDFNAEAVKWNLERYRTSKNSELKSVKSIDIVDGYTVRLNLSKWSSTLMNAMVTYPGIMISPTAFKKLGPDKIKLNPVGTGPFKLKSWKRDISLKFERFNNYWQKGKPYLDGIEYFPIKNPMSRQASLKAGEVDGVMIVEYQFIKDLVKTGKFYSLGPGLSTIIVDFIGDSAHPDSPFADIRVRRAISHAVNRQELVDTINHGYGQVMNQYATKGSWGYNPNVKGYPYNPEKAKKLLAEAGYAKGLKFKMASPNFGTFKYPPPAIQEYFRKVGIQAEIVLNDMGKHNSTLYNGWRNILLEQPGALVFPDAANNMFSYASCNSRYKFKGTVLCPDDYMDALDKALKAPDFETKQKWTWEAQRLLVDKYCLVNFFTTNPRVHVFSKKVHDINFEAITTTQWTPEDAWLEQ